MLLPLQVLAQLQTAPRPTGNWFPFTPQAAQNTLLASRFPAGWTNPANRIFIQGYGVPGTADVVDAQRRMSNAGFTHMERDVFVQRLNLPVAKRYRMITDAEGQAMAKVWGAELADSDARKQHVLNYGYNRSLTSTDMSIWRELGRRTYLAMKGQGLGLVGFDIETFADGTSVDLAHEFNRACNLGVIDAIKGAGDNTLFFQYGGTLANVVNYTKNKQDGDIYMRLPGSDWQGAGGLLDINANELVKYYRSKVSYLGRDQYARRTFDDRSLWQKNNDGSIKLDGSGNPLMIKFNYGVDKVTNFGVQSIVYPYEPLYWLQMWYEEADKILTDWRFLCNTPINYDGNQTVGSMPYPKGTYDIRPGMENIRLSSFYRDETEAEAMYNPDISDFQYHESGNNRPLNPRSTRYQLLMRSVLYHGNIIWSDKASYVDITQGKTYVANQGGQNVTLRPLALGQFEQMIAGNYQGKNFPKLFDLMDAGQIEFIIPNRFIYKGNVAKGQREIDKPIIWLNKERGGRRVFGIWAYPAQDVGNAAHNTEIKTWIKLDDGTTSGSWSLSCVDRNTAYDAWMIPTGFENAKPSNWIFQMKNILGETYTWTGDYNVAWSGANPSPPAAIARVLLKAGTGVSGGGGGAETPVLRSYDSKTYLAEVGGTTRQVAAAYFGTSTTTKPSLSSVTAVAMLDGETPAQAVATAQASSSRNRWVPGEWSNIREKVVNTGLTSTIVTQRRILPVHPLQTLSSNGGMHPIARRLFSFCISKGANSIQPLWHWHHFEKSPGVYDWTLLDECMDYAASKGVDCQPKFIFFRDNYEGRNPAGFIADSEAWTAQDGTVNKAGNSTYPSLNSVSVTAHIETALKAAITHILSRPSGSRLISVSWGYSQNFESDYNYATGLGVGAFDLYDFSAPAKAAFRSWALAKYGGRSAINSQWSTSWTSDDQITTPTFSDNTDPFVGFNTTWKKDFYLFREKTQADFQQRLHLAVKSINPGIATVWDSGNFQDALARVRGTERSAGLTDQDGIKSNNIAADVGGYNPYLTNAIARREMKANQFAWGEIDCNASNTAEQLINQGISEFRSGASCLTIWNLIRRAGDESEDGLQFSEAFLGQVIDGILAQTPLSQPVPRTYEVTMEVKESDIFRATWANGYDGNPPLRGQFLNLTNNNAKSARVIILRGQ